MQQRDSKGPQPNDPDHAHEPGATRGRYDPAQDPMRMGNQPALQTSTGALWLVMGALFAIITIGTLVAIALTTVGGAATVGWSTAATVLMLFLAMVIVRIVTKRGRRRLIWMAVFFLAMAAVALGGIWLTAVYSAAGQMM
ncbi:hypothetical protein ACXR2W_01850 [Leucobacter sp. HY1908]